MTKNKLANIGEKVFKYFVLRNPYNESTLIYSSHNLDEAQEVAKRNDACVVSVEFEPEECTLDFDYRSQEDKEEQEEWVNE